jgi:hypothetical protein
MLMSGVIVTVGNRRICVRDQGARSTMYACDAQTQVFAGERGDSIRLEDLLAGETVTVEPDVDHRDLVRTIWRGNVMNPERRVRLLDKGLPIRGNHENPADLPPAPDDFQIYSPGLSNNCPDPTVQPMSLGRGRVRVQRSGIPAGQQAPGAGRHDRSSRGPSDRLPTAGVSGGGTEQGAGTSELTPAEFQMGAKAEERPAPTLGVQEALPKEPPTAPLSEGAQKQKGEIEDKEKAMVDAQSKKYGPRKK